MVQNEQKVRERECVFKRKLKAKRVVNQNPLLGNSKARKKGRSEKRMESGIFQSRRRDGVKNGERGNLAVSRQSQNFPGLISCKKKRKIKRKVSGE